MKRTLIIGCLALLIGCGAKTVDLPVQMKSSVLHHDGTVVLRTTDGRETQLAGIKVPEYDDDRTSEYRAMSRHILHRLVVGKPLTLEYEAVGTGNPHPSGYIYAGAVFVNAEMIKRGYAYSMPTSANGKYDAMFQSLEQEAKAERRGLWHYALTDVYTLQ